MWRETATAATTMWLCLMGEKWMSHRRSASSAETAHPCKTFSLSSCSNTPLTTCLQCLLCIYFNAEAQVCNLTSRQFLLNVPHTYFKIIRPLQIYLLFVSCIFIYLLFSIHLFPSALFIQTAIISLSSLFPIWVWLRMDSSVITSLNRGAWAQSAPPSLPPAPPHPPHDL